ncbi:hypothetical protein L1887_13784 [Cichorium endivia]|nr:hypothetical protein L1887_13784 [Cichorium endivia]
MRIWIGLGSYIRISCFLHRLTRSRISVFYIPSIPNLSQSLFSCNPPPPLAAPLLTCKSAGKRRSPCAFGISVFFTVIAAPPLHLSVTCSSSENGKMKRAIEIVGESPIEEKRTDCII